MRTGEKTGRILDILDKIPVWLLTPFITAILAVSLIKRAEYCGYKHSDNPVWIRQDTILLIVTVILLLGIFILVYRLSEKLGRFGRKQVVWTILYLSLVIQVLYILYLPAKQFADQNIVNQISLDMINGKFTAFQKKGYLYQYPNNVGITLLLTIIYRIFLNSLLVPKLLNVVFSSATAYLVFRTYEETCRPEDGKGYGILLFAGFFPPMILLNNLVYNDIIATTLFAGVVFEAVRYVRIKKLRHLILAGLYIISGNFLRQVGIILLIAATLYFAIKRIRTIKILAFFVIVIIVCRLPMTAVNYYLLHTGKISEPIGLNSIPIHMWINMGMNEKKFGYWDNAQSLNIYMREGGWDKAKSTDIYMTMIKQNIQEKGILRIARVYAKKDIWLWTEGTYQAEYYGIGSWGYLYPTFATKLFTNNNLLRDYARWILHTTNYLMLALSCVGLIRSIRKKSHYPLILPAIVLLGFIGFYTIWEIKPRYIYLIYPYLILMAYHGLGIVSDGLKLLIQRLRRKQPDKGISPEQGIGSQNRAV